MLSSPVENVVLSGKEKISGPRVAIGPVSIPGYLDRPQLFLRDGNDVKVELAEFNHWSEPFGEGVTRVLCDAVSASLTPRKGLASPMRSQQPFLWRIAVDIARFDGTPNGSVILDAGWSLVNESGEELKSGRFVQHAPAGPDIPSMVQAQRSLRRGEGTFLQKGPLSPPLSLQRLLTLSNPPWRRSLFIGNAAFFWKSYSCCRGREDTPASPLFNL